jgi:hypothetical protein
MCMIILHGILHVPDLASNLISLGTLQHKGATYHTSEDGLVVTLQGDKLFPSNPHQTPLPCPTNPPLSHMQDVSSSGSWCRYQGHLHLNAISQVAKYQAKGLTFMSDQTCEACTLTAAYHSGIAQRHYKRMDLLIVHISGPMSTPMWTSKTRMLITIEMGSGLSVGELLATENDTTKALKTIIMRLEQESKKKLKMICTKSDNTYLHEVVEDICKKNGIQHDLPPESK